ncbi:MAG: response regulator [Patescibacteria group bacterium]|nr:response regulator [Patescibacteria group bacterium]
MADLQNTIMVIEDDPFLSSILKARFEKDGFQVIQAFNGEEALAKLRESTPGIVILDLIMPKMSGFEVLQAISLDPQLNKIPVVVVSNLGQPGDMEKAKGFGAIDYFVKMRMSIDELIVKIRDIVTKNGMK